MSPFYCATCFSGKAGALNRKDGHTLMGWLDSWNLTPWTLPGPEALDSSITLTVHCQGIGPEVVLALDRACVSSAVRYATVLADRGFFPRRHPQRSCMILTRYWLNGLVASWGCTSFSRPSPSSHFASGPSG